MSEDPDLPDDVRAAMEAAEPENAPKRRGRPPKPVEAPAGMVNVEIVRDWWDEEEVRHRAGTVIPLPPKQALGLVSRGIAKEPGAE
ncbi:MAG: hypothetical protein LCH88_09140 [Proteobacteria bacterium]|nr:hypothetical protein [Pseudomonadota bacterium]